MKGRDLRCSLRFIWWAVAGTAGVGGVEAQAGRIGYERTAALDIEVPREMVGILEMLMTRDGTGFSVYFAPSGYVMVPRDDVRGGKREILVFPLTHRHASGLIDIIAAWHETDENIMRHGYVGADGVSTVRVVRSVRRTLRVESARIPVAWEVTEDSGEYLGFRVAKATSGTGSSRIEAWYSPDIPVSGGPANYGGLPGMILQLAVRGGRIRYDATEIDLDSVEVGKIILPDEGELVSEEEYRSIIAGEVRQMRRALQEVRTMFRGPAECSIRNEGSRLSLDCFQR